MAVVFVACLCDSRVRIIDHFDREVKPIQQEIKKPRKIFSGVCVGCGSFCLFLPSAQFHAAIMDFVEIVSHVVIPAFSGFCSLSGV